jgi:hypothetical protein
MKPSVIPASGAERGNSRRCRQISGQVGPGTGRVRGTVQALARDRGETETSEGG